MYRDVLDGEGKLLVRLKYYHDEGMGQPTGYRRLWDDMVRIHETYGQFATYVLDCLTSVEFIARMHEKYVLNPQVKDHRQWWAGSTDAVEEIIMRSLAGLPFNVAVTAHVSKDKDEMAGYLVHNPDLPGRLEARLAAYFGEFYHSHVVRDDKGQPVYLLQTRTDSRYAAGSLIGAPDPCVNTYEAMWRRGVQRRPVHCLVYGLPHSGKTTFCASWPKPMVVYFSDAYQKDEPYLRLGTPTELKEDA